MSKAIEAVRQGSSSILRTRTGVRATIAHGVPRQALQDRISDGVTHGYDLRGPSLICHKLQRKIWQIFL